MTVEDVKKLLNLAADYFHSRLNTNLRGLVMSNGQKRSEDVEPAVSAPGWKAPLNIVGLFIGTHGLAVFLVIYYTLYLYPRAELERRDWIERITRVQQLLEPETRTLTPSQAETVLSIAKSAFIQQLESETNMLSSYVSARWAVAVPPQAGREDDRNIWLWDERFEQRTQKGDEQAAMELQNILRRFNELFEQRQNTYRHELIAAFDQARSRGEILRYQLGRLRINQVALDEVWQKAWQGCDRNG